MWTQVVEAEVPGRGPQGRRPLSLWSWGTRVTQGVILGLQQSPHQPRDVCPFSLLGEKFWSMFFSLVAVILIDTTPALIFKEG